MKSFEFKKSDGFEKFLSEYKASKDDQFGLFLGAGINLPTSNDTNCKFQVYSWKALIKELCKRTKNSYEELVNEHGEDWIIISDKISKNIGEKKFLKSLENIFYAKIPRNDPYGRLSIHYLRQAPVLHSSIAFSAKIKNKTKTNWTFERNPKVGIICTTNYDFFFGAGWTRYESFKSHWKVHTPYSQYIKNNKQRLIHYIHGYIPYSKANKKNKERKSIVLTKESYDRFYKDIKVPGKNAEGYSRISLRDALSNYTLIFIGLSFNDPPLCEELLNSKPNKHYAFVKSKDAGIAHKLGVQPIEIENYSDIEIALGLIYQSALSKSSLKLFGLNTNNEYWSQLIIGKKSH